MSSEGENYTVQGHGYPVPATFGSEQVGSQSSKSIDHNVSAVVHLAAETDNTTSAATAVANSAAARELGNPFQRNNRIVRSPPTTRKTSLADINLQTSQPNENNASLIALKQDTASNTAVGDLTVGSSSSTSQFTLQAAGSSERNIYLENENMELWRRLQKMEQLFAKLSEEITYLKQENEKLKINRDSEDTSKIEVSETNKINYYTDEDEVDRETNWIMQKKKKESRKSKKRKAESSPEIDKSIDIGSSSIDPKANQHEINQIKTSDTTKNIAPKLVQPKEKLPPPINIVGVRNYLEIQTMMKSVTDKEYKVTALNNDVWKINTPDSDTYRTLSMKLNTEKYQWFTYEDKQTRPIKVMARGLHHTCASKDIVEDLENKGLKILDAVNIVKKERTENGEGNQTINKRGLPLFMLTFDNKENIQTIYGIKGILHMKVKIEPLKRTTVRIPQCKKCQGFNHTQKYCGRDPRCVKCSGKHMTQVCTVGRDVPAKCINCKGQHPANYRGCEVAKQLQKLRDQPRNHPQNLEYRKIQTTKQMDQNLPSSSAGQMKTFSQIVKGSGSVKFMDSGNSRIMENIMISIEAITKRLDEQSNLNNIILAQLKKLQVPQKKPIRNVK